MALFTSASDRPGVINARIFVPGHNMYIFREANSFPRAGSSRKTVSFEEQLTSKDYNVYNLSVSSRLDSGDSLILKFQFVKLRALRNR